MGAPTLAAVALVALAALYAVPAAAEGPAHEFITSWGSLGASGEGRFSGPTGIASDHEGNVYVTDTGNGRVQKFNNSGGFVAEWSAMGNSTESLSSPMGIAVLDNRVYVIDSILESVVVYDLDGTYVSSWGSHGGDAGEFLQPRGIAAGNGRIYVTDTGNSRAQAFSAEGAHISTFGTDRDEAAHLRSPVGIAVANDASVFIVDPGKMSLFHYGVDGELLDVFDGTVAGKSLRARGMAVDGDGKLYLADARNDRVLRLEPDGLTLSAWGDAGAGAYKYLMPTDVTVDIYGQLFVVDSGGHSIKKYSTPLALDDSERIAVHEEAARQFRISQGLEEPEQAAEPAQESAPPAARPAPPPAQPTAQPAPTAPVARSAPPTTPPAAQPAPVATATLQVTQQPVATAQPARVMAVPGDLTKPTIYAPHDITAEASGPLTRINVGMATASDESGIHSITSNAPSEFSLGTSLVIWTAIDGAGNLAIARQEVTVSDTTPPAMAGVPDISVEAVSPDRNYIEIRAPVATDAVGVLDVSSDAPDHYPVGQTTITWTARDISGNTASATQVVSVLDTSAPQIVAPPEITAEATSLDATVVFLGDASVVDNGRIVSVTNDAPPSFALGNTTVMWIAVDSSGNRSHDAQVVAIVDTTPPEIIVREGTVVEAESADSTAVDLEEPEVSDVQRVRLTSDAPASFALGETTVTWTATDPSGNTSTSAQLVTVADTTPPAIDITRTITAEASRSEGNTVSLGEVAVTDVSEIAGLANDAPESYALGETTVTWNATDIHGNTATAEQTVILVDTVSPSIFAPADVTAEYAGEAGNSVNVGTPVAADRVGVASVSSDAPDTFGLGETTVTWTATDTSGNESTALQTITIVDTLAPAIRPPPDVSAEATAESGTAVEVGRATAADESGEVTVTSDAPALFELGTTTVTWTATDTSGNMMNATQRVSVTDTIPPEISAPAGIRAEADSEDANTVDLGTARATDAAGSVTVTSDAPLAFPVGTTTVTWTAVDSSGNESTDTQEITFVDTTKPTVYAPGDVTAEAGPDVRLDIGEATATDAVGVDAITSDAPDSFGPGETTVTWTATDAAGNSASATHTVTIIDTTQPLIVPPLARTIEAMSENGSAADIGWPTHSDAGGGVTIEGDAPATFPIGVTAVTWTATDAAGNVRSATQSVTVSDTIAPSVTPPADITAEATSRNLTVVEIGEATATDAVGVVAITSDAPAAFALGETTVAWTATDAAGNSASGLQMVTIVDTTPPSLSAPADVTAEASSSGTTSVDIGEPESTDTVSEEIVITSDAPDGYELGETTVTWTATDAAGNSASHEQLVTVEDTTPPTVVPPADIVAEAESSDGSVVDIGIAGTEDSVGTISLTSDEPALFPIGETTVTWTATDAAGNEGTAAQLVTVTDTVAPRIVSPIDIVAESTSTNGTRIVLGDASTSDAVGVTSVSNDAPELFGLGRTMVTWEATDEAGNIAVALQSVTLRDTVAPQIETPSGMTLNATAPFTSVTLSIPILSDAVDTSPVLVSDAPDSFALGTTMVTWNATDAAGNTSSVVQPVTVLACGTAHSTYNVIRGTAGDDSLVGTSAADLIFALAGNDVISAGGGNDCVIAGDGDDVVIGGDGADILGGNAGDDVVRGQDGDDLLDGGEGSDVIDGGDGSDSCVASAGDSVLRCEA